MSSESPTILRPIPRRPFDLNFTAPTPPDRSPSPSPSHEPAAAGYLDAKIHGSGAETPGSFSRTRSILNLTSSTLFGIYSPTGYSNDRDEPSTPWGTGAETPRERASIDSGSPRPTFSMANRRRRSSMHVPQQPSMSSYLFNLVVRTILLFGFGMGYGLLVTHLHDDQKLAPFQVEGIMKPSYDWRYLVCWGVAGVGLGSLLPWVDMFWEDDSRERGGNGNDKVMLERPMQNDDEEVVTAGSESGLAADWNPVVRSIGAFVGIAFAIRKLPWASTLQVSLTLALVNPVLWYLIDRSKPGFLLSATVGLFGTTILLSLNPEIIPSPSAPAGTFLGMNSTATGGTNRIEALGGLVTKETVECGTWIISVLFCSCVCFGNIGRRLALKGGRSPVIFRKSRESFR